MTRDIREILEIYKVDSNPNEKKKLLLKGKKLLKSNSYKDTQY